MNTSSKHYFRGGQFVRTSLLVPKYCSSQIIVNVRHFVYYYFLGPFYLVLKLIFHHISCVWLHKLLKILFFNSYYIYSLIQNKHIIKLTLLLCCKCFCITAFILSCHKFLCQLFLTSSSSSRWKPIYSIFIFFL